MHVSQHYRIGCVCGQAHNCPAWVKKVNHIAPLLGLKKLEAGQTEVRRVVVEGEFTSTGKPRTKPARVQQGNVPYECVAPFPHALFERFGLTDYHRRGELPFERGER